MKANEITNRMAAIGCDQITKSKSNSYQFFKVGTRKAVQFGFQSCGYTASRAKELTRAFFGGL